MQVRQQDLGLPPGHAATAPERPAQLRLSGRLDFAATRRIGPRLLELARTGRILDVDLGGVVAIEPAGLALLIGCRRLAHASGGQLRLVAASPAADRALLRNGLYRVLPLGGSTR